MCVEFSCALCLPVGAGPFFIMPGSATLDPAVFLDSIVEVIDDVRRDIKEGLGFRQFIVATVAVTPTHRRAGGPSPTARVVTVFDPLPQVKPYQFENSLEPCGIEEAGLLEVTEISLSYTEAELTGKDLPDGTEFYWRLTDNHGQETCERYFQIHRAPYPERNCCPGWKIMLRRAEAPL